MRPTGAGLAFRLEADPPSRVAPPSLAAGFAAEKGTRPPSGDTADASECRSPIGVVDEVRAVGGHEDEVASVGVGCVDAGWPVDEEVEDNP